MFFQVLGGSGTTTYAIDQSIRFNEVDSPYMQKTYSGDGSRTTWSFSFWTKLGKSPPYNTTRGIFLIAYNTSSGAQEDIRIEGSNQQLQWFTHNDGGTGTLADLKTTQYLRDHSAWYHILCVADRTNAVAEERQRMYINGQRVTDFATETYPSKDAEGHVGKSADVHYIGSRAGNSNTRIDGYMAEIHFLDGYAYEPSFFGEFNSSGIWIPKEYTGSYGSNGFKIDGRDASDLGDDESGNGNDFTTSGLASDDQQPDSPTNNHCTWNPIEAETLITYSNGNLAIAYSGNSARNMARSTIQIPASTDAFFEMVMTSNLGSGVDFAIGIEDGTAQSDNSNSIYNNAYVIREDGNFIDQSSSGSYGVSFTNTDVIGVWRKANGDLVFYKNGTAMNSGTPAKTGLTGTMFFVAGPFNGASAEARFASSKWTNKPSGVTDSMALNTSNLGS